MLSVSSSKYNHMKNGRLNVTRSISKKYHIKYCYKLDFDCQKCVFIYSNKIKLCFVKYKVLSISEKTADGLYHFILF